MQRPESIRLALVEHREFMLRVAREICREDLAEDAVQDASLYALRRPPRHDGSLRAWLRRAVVTSSLQILRSGSRLRRREHVAARPEHVPADEVEDGSLRERIELALDALREPYREVLRLRLDEELESEEIARRLGRKLATVRSQLLRGRALLCEELDRRHGDRRTWLVPLALHLDPGAVAPALPAPARISARVGAGAALLAAAGVVLWLALRPPTTALVEPVGAGATELAAAPELTATDVVAPVREALGTTEREAAAPGVLRSVSGRCVDASGAGVADARVFVLPPGTGALPQPYEDTALLQVRCDTRGAFRLAGLEDDVLLVATDREGRVSREVAHVVSGGPRALELELVLERGRRVQGLAVDASGSPVAHAALELHLPSRQPGVDVRAEGAGLLFHRDLPIRGFAGADGRFELLQPARDGRRVWARAPGLPDGRARVPGIEELVVRLAADQRAFVRARSADGAPLGGVLVEVYALGVEEPFRGTTDARGQCELEGLPGSKHFIARLTRDDLMPLVTLPSDPEYPAVTLRRRGGRPGRVLDTDGSPAGDALVRAYHLQRARAARAAGFSETASRRLSLVAETRTDASGRFELPDYDDDLYVEVAPSARGRRTVQAFPRFDPSLEIRLPAGDALVRGRVRSPSGAAVPNFRVRAHELTVATSRVGAWQERTAADGAFEWPASCECALTLEFAAPGYATRLVPALADGAPLDVVLEPARDVELRLVDARGLALAGADVVCADGEGAPRDLPCGPQCTQSRLTFDGAGAARLADAPAGAWRLTLRVAGFHEPLVAHCDPGASDDDVVEARVAANLGGEREPLLLRLRRGEPRTCALRLRARDRDGALLFDERIVWGPRDLQAPPPFPLRAKLREGGAPGRWIAASEWSRAPRPALELGDDPRSASIELPLPVGEPVTLELETGTAPDAPQTIELGPLDRAPLTLTWPGSADETRAVQVSR